MHCLHHLIRHRQHTQQPRPPIHRRGGRPCLQTSQHFHRPGPDNLIASFLNTALPSSTVHSGPLQCLLETRDTQQLLEDSQRLLPLQEGSPLRPFFLPHHFYHQHHHPHLRAHGQRAAVQLPRGLE